MAEKIGLLIIVLLFTFTMHCSNTVFLENDGAYMPVEVIGNSSSNTLIVMVHGGPGSGSIMYYSKDENFKPLEDKYKIAYYDQRLAGISQGKADPSQLKLSQYVEDLHKIVILLRYLHKPRYLIIMGHSFGGMLSVAYLSSFGQDDSISGFIDIDGLHNTSLAYSSSIERIRTHANNQILSGIDVGYWNEALSFYRTTDTTRLLKSTEHYAYVIKSDGVHYTKPISYVNFSKLFFSEASGLDNLINSNISLSSIGDDITQADLSGSLPKLRLPILVAWGRHDGIVPLAVGNEAFHRVGTTDSLKRFVIFEESAHEPFIEQRDAFCDSVIDFIESCVK